MLSSKPHELLTLIMEFYLPPRDFNGLPASHAAGVGLHRALRRGDDRRFQGVEYGFTMSCRPSLLVDRPIALSAEIQVRGECGFLD